jgi:transcription elongation factor Elf1
MSLDLGQYKRRSKRDPVPGTVEAYLETKCPKCGTERLVIIKPCCGAPKGYLYCKGCGHEKIME